MVTLSLSSLLSLANPIHGSSWDIDCDRPSAHTIDIFRNETINLSPRFVQSGVPMVLTNVVSVYLKYTDGTLLSNLCYAATGYVSAATSGYVTIIWTPSNEAAASSYAYTIEVNTLDGKNPRGFGRILLKDVVGGSTTNTPAVHATIDWATVLNSNQGSAPWYPTNFSVTNVHFDAILSVPTIWPGTATDDVARALATNAQNTAITAYDRSTNTDARVSVVETNSVTPAQLAIATNSTVIAATQRVAAVGYLLPDSTQNLASVGQVVASTNAINSGFLASKGALTNESDTLSTVAARGNSWTGTLTVGSIALTNQAVVMSGPVDGNYGMEANASPVGNSQTSSVWVGYVALYQSFGSFNTALGGYSLYQSPGSENVGIGRSTLYQSPGSQNSALGRSALRESAGSFNAALGYEAIYQSAGNYNVGGGWQSLYQAPGSGNVGIGRGTLFQAPGSLNLAAGHQAGNRSGGVSNVFLGANSANTTSGTNTFTNAITLGAGTVPLGNNSMALGNANTSNTLIRGNVTISNSLTVVGASTLALASGSTAVRPTETNHVANKAYVDSVSVNVQPIVTLTETNPVFALSERTNLVAWVPTVSNITLYPTFTAPGPGYGMSGMIRFVNTNGCSILWPTNVAWYVNGARSTNAPTLGVYNRIVFDTWDTMITLGVVSTNATAVLP